MSAPTPAVARERPTAWEWLQVALLAGNLIWTTLCLGGYRPETMVVTSALNGLLLAVHLLSRAAAQAGRLQPGLHPAGWLPLPFLVYAALNVWWVTPVRWLGWQDWLEWAQLALVFWVVLNGVRSTAGRTALLSVIVALALGSVALQAYQRFVRPDWLMMHRIQAEQFIGRASGPFGVPNSLAALFILLLPLLGVLTCRRGAGALARVFFGYCTLVLLFGLVLTISRGAWLALAATLVLWPLMAMQARGVRRLAIALLVALSIGSTAGGLYVALPGVRARIDALRSDHGERTRPIMWRGAWKIFAEQPVCGGGAGAYNVRFEKYRPVDYQDEPRWSHCDYLNTLADYGLVGLLLAVAPVGVVVWRSRRPARGERRDWLDTPVVQSALRAGLGAFALHLLVDFDLKLPALAMIFATLAAIVVRSSWPLSFATAGGQAGRRLAFAGAAAGVCLGTLVFVQPIYRAEARRYSARQTLDRLGRTRARAVDERPALVAARAALAEAVALDPCNAQAWADYAYVTALWAHLEPDRVGALGSEAQERADRALALSAIVPEFWIRRAVALDLQDRRVEAGRALVRALQLAPARATVWYYQAFHLSLNRRDPGPARAAVDFCLRLDPANPDALALRERLSPGSNNP